VPLISKRRNRYKLVDTAKTFKDAGISCRFCKLRICLRVYPVKRFRIKTPNYITYVNGWEELESHQFSQIRVLDFAPHIALQRTVVLASTIGEMHMHMQRDLASEKGREKNSTGSTKQN